MNNSEGNESIEDRVRAFNNLIEQLHLINEGNDNSEDYLNIIKDSYKFNADDSTSSSSTSSTDSSTPSSFEAVVCYRKFPEQFDTFSDSGERSRFISKSYHLKPHFELNEIEFDPVKISPINIDTINNKPQENKTPYTISNNDKMVISKTMEVLARISVSNNIIIQNTLSEKYSLNTDAKLSTNITTNQKTDDSVEKQTDLINNLKENQMDSDKLFLPNNNLENIQNKKIKETAANGLSSIDPTNQVNLQMANQIKKTSQKLDKKMKSSKSLVDMPLDQELKKNINCDQFFVKRISEKDFLNLLICDLLNITISNFLNLKLIPFSLIWNCRNYRKKQRSIKWDHLINSHSNPLFYDHKINFSYLNRSFCKLKLLCNRSKSKYL